MAPVVDDDLGDTCAWCGKKDVDLACTRCKSVVYCGRQCQRAHWPGHKVECARLEREASAPPALPPTRLVTGDAGSPEYRREQEKELQRRAKLEAEEQFRQHLERMNKLRAQEARRAVAERQRQKREEAFFLFIESLRRPLLPRLPPCGPRDKVPVIVCGPAKAVQRRVEPAGAAFHELFERPSPSFRSPAEEKSRRRSQSKGPKREASTSRARSSSAARSSRGSRSRSQNFPESRSKFNMHKAPPSPALEGIELFTLLGLEMKPGYSPTQDDLREAYRRAVLAAHPDKRESQDTDAVVLVHAAYEFLVDVDNRQTYESSLPFDDSIPSEEKIQAKGFFKTFRPVFIRNSKWSVETPVPDLGNAETPMEEVREFYRFWYDFTTWRDVSPKFLKANEMELEDIYDCRRGERRERIRHNVSVRRKFQVYENLRITKLVDLAWKHDPRLEEVRRKGRKKDEPEEVEEEEEEEPEEQISEEERRRREAALEEERRIERELREEQRQAAKKRRARLRKVVEELHLRFEADELRRLCAALSPESVEALTAEVEKLSVQALHSDSGEGSEDSLELERRERSREQAGRAKRKSSKQLAQEAIFEAMRGAGMEPTETQLSPEEAEALERAEAQAKEQAERARRERAKKRRLEEKEERRRKKEDDLLQEQRLVKERQLQDRKNKLRREIEQLTSAGALKYEERAAQLREMDEDARHVDEGPQESEDGEDDGDEDYYELLGVPPSASAAEIKDAFLRSRRDYDIKDRASQEEHRKIARVFEALYDPLKRELYDLFGAASVLGTVDPELIPKDLEATLTSKYARVREDLLDKNAPGAAESTSWVFAKLSANFGKRGLRDEPSVRADPAVQRAAQVERDDLDRIVGKLSSLEQRAATIDRLREYLDVMRRMASIADQSWTRRTWKEEIQCWSGVDEARRDLEAIERRGIEVDCVTTSQVLMTTVTRHTKEDIELMELMQEGSPLASGRTLTAFIEQFDPLEHLDMLENLAQHEREMLIRERKKVQKRERQEQRKQQRQQEDEERQQQRQRAEQERQQRAEELAIRNAKAERDLQAFERSGDPATAERVQRLTEFMRIGGTADAAGEVARAAIKAAPELSELFRSMEAHRLTDPEGYADDILGLLAECAVPFFELGIRPRENAPKLPPMVRTKVKHARTALRSLVKKRCLALDEEPEPSEAPEPSVDKTAAGRPAGGAGQPRARSRARSASVGARRSGSRRQR